MRYQNLFFRALLIVLTGIIFLVASGCRKSQPDNFPNVGFETYVYLNNPSNQILQQPGGWVYHDGGYRGLIIYRRQLTGAADDFGVYDRGCPEHFSENCGILEVTDDDLFAECPCEGERYLLLDGSPAENARLGLKMYPGSLNSGVLYIRN